MSRKSWQPASESWLVTLERRTARIGLVQSLERLVRKHPAELKGLPCFFCGQNLTDLPWSEITIDHLRPRSRGGISLEENLALCCLECNQVKGDMSVAEFIRTHPPPRNAPVRFLFPELFAGEDR